MPPPAAPSHLRLPTVHESKAMECGEEGGGGGTGGHACGDGASDVRGCEEEGRGVQKMEVETEEGVQGDVEREKEGGHGVAPMSEGGVRSERTKGEDKEGGSRGSEGVEGGEGGAEGGRQGVGLGMGGGESCNQVEVTQQQQQQQQQLENGVKEQHVGLDAPTQQPSQQPQPQPQPQQQQQQQQQHTCSTLTPATANKTSALRTPGHNTPTAASGLLPPTTTPLPRTASVAAVNAAGHVVTSQPAAPTHSTALREGNRYGDLVLGFGGVRSPAGVFSFKEAESLVVGPKPGLQQLPQSSQQSTPATQHVLPSAQQSTPATQHALPSAQQSTPPTQLAAPPLVSHAATTESASHTDLHTGPPVLTAGAAATGAVAPVRDEGTGTAATTTTTDAAAAAAAAGAAAAGAGAGGAAATGAIAPERVEGAGAAATTTDAAAAAAGGAAATTDAAAGAMTTTGGAARAAAAGGAGATTDAAAGAITASKGAVTTPHTCKPQCLPATRTLSSDGLTHPPTQPSSITHAPAPHCVEVQPPSAPPPTAPPPEASAAPPAPCTAPSTAATWPAVTSSLPTAAPSSLPLPTAMPSHPGPPPALASLPAAHAHAPAAIVVASVEEIEGWRARFREAMPMIGQLEAAASATTEQVGGVSALQHVCWCDE